MCPPQRKERERIALNMFDVRTYSYICPASSPCCFQIFLKHFVLTPMMKTRVFLACYIY